MWCYSRTTVYFTHVFKKMLVGYLGLIIFMLTMNCQNFFSKSGHDIMHHKLYSRYNVQTLNALSVDQPASSSCVAIRDEHDIFFSKQLCLSVFSMGEL